MYHQLCNQMHFKVLHNKTEGVEKFFLPKKTKALLTKKKTGKNKTQSRCLIMLKALVSVEV